MSADAKRIAEAEQCVVNAQKALKTSPFTLKFSPDHDMAAVEYERAAVCYKNASRPIDAKQMYLNAAQQHALNNNSYKCAGNKEQAAYICRDQNDFVTAKTLMEDAARLYEECGTTEVAVNALEKAAKFFEGTDDAKAIEIYRKAHYMTLETDKTRQQCEFLNRLTKLYVRQENYTEAIWALSSSIDVYREMNEPSKVGQLTTAVVLCALALNNPNQADELLSKSATMSGFMQTEDRQTCPQLITAFRNGDETHWKQTIQRPHVRAMDNELLKMLPKIKLPEKVKGHGAANQGDDEDDEEDMR